jgi:hypothetical protein
MRSPRTPTLHLLPELAQVCRLMSQLYVLLGDPARFSVLENSHGERCCRAWLGSATRTTRPARPRTTGLSADQSH